MRSPACSPSARYNGPPQFICQLSGLASLSFSPCSPNPNISPAPPGSLPPGPSSRPFQSAAAGPCRSRISRARLVNESLNQKHLLSLPPALINHLTRSPSSHFHFHSPRVAHHRSTLRRAAVQPHSRAAGGSPRLLALPPAPASRRAHRSAPLHRPTECGGCLGSIDARGVLRCVRDGGWGVRLPNRFRFRGDAGVAVAGNAVFVALVLVNAPGDERGWGEVDWLWGYYVK
jgi:hypothetical protein